MPWTSIHIKWLVKDANKLKTANGKNINVYEFLHVDDDDILSKWAKHFRNHYCLDAEIDQLRHGFGYSRSEYLEKIKFPDSSVAPGPSIRAGDFGEILTADYLEYKLKYWVPRTRYSNRTVRNESTQGSDVMGFKVIDKSKDSAKDVLAIYEAKAQFTGVIAKPRLQDAVNHSAKDELRKAESLNALKQRFQERKEVENAVRIDRFQNPEDRPYIYRSGAVALFSSNLYDSGLVSQTTTKKHLNSKRLRLIVIHGDALMELVSKLYDRAASEA